MNKKKNLTICFLAIAGLGCTIGATSGAVLAQVKADNATCYISTKKKIEAKEIVWDNKLAARKIALSKLKEVTCPEDSIVDFTSAGTETVSENEVPVLQSASSFTLTSKKITGFTMSFSNDTGSSKSVEYLPLSIVTAYSGDKSGNINIESAIPFKNNEATLSISSDMLSTLKIGAIDKISFTLDEPKANDSYTLGFDTISFDYDSEPTPTTESLTISGSITTTEYSSTTTKWDTDGLTVTYVDGKGKEMIISNDDENLVWSFDPLSPAKAGAFEKVIPLTISATYLGKIVSNEVIENVTVHQAIKTVSKVELTGSMSTKDYLNTTSSWDKTGLIVTVYYTDAPEEIIDVTSDELTWDFDPATPTVAEIGQNTLKIHVTYKEHTSARNKQIVYVNQQVSKPVVHSMKWLVDQYPTTWYVGNVYDQSILRLVNEKDEEITDYAIFSFDKTMAQLNDKTVTVTVSYTNEDTSIVVTPLVKTFKVEVWPNESLVLTSITVSGKPNMVDFSRKADCWDFTGMTATGKDADNNTYEHVEYFDNFEWQIDSTDPANPSQVTKPTTEVTLHVSATIGSKKPVSSEAIEVPVYIYDTDTPPAPTSFVMEGDLATKHYYLNESFSAGGLEVIGINDHGSRDPLKIEDPTVFSFNPATPQLAAQAGGNVRVTYTSGDDTASIDITGIKYHNEEAYDLSVDGELYKTTFTQGDDASFDTNGLTLVKDRGEGKDHEKIVSTPEDPITIRFNPLTPDEAEIGDEQTLSIEYTYRGETTTKDCLINIVSSPSTARYTITGDFSRKTYYVGEEWDYGNVRINYYEAGMSSPTRTWTAKEALEKTSVETNWVFTVSPERATYGIGTVTISIVDYAVSLETTTLVINDISVNQTFNNQNYVQISETMEEHNVKVTTSLKTEALLTCKLALESDGEDPNAFVWDGSTKGSYTETTKTKDYPPSLKDMPTTWLEFGFMDPSAPKEMYAQVFTGTLDDNESLGYITCACSSATEDIVLSQDKTPVNVFVNEGVLSLTVINKESTNESGTWILIFDSKNNRFCFSNGGGKGVNVYTLGKDYQRATASNELVERCMGANNMLSTMCGTGYVSEEDWNEMYKKYFEDFVLTGSDLIAMQQGIALHTDDPSQKVYIQEFLAKYDYIVSKYGYTAFIEGRDVSPSPKVKTMSNTIYIVVSVIAITSLAGFATLITVKKKKEQK